jgi:hypothetical protein
MFLLMRRLLAVSVLAAIAVCALASSAFARTPRPVITSVTPTKVAVGGVLTLKGKNFASGTRNNRVFFSRASDGKSVRVRPRKASKTRIDVLVPASLTPLLADDGLGGKKETRFRLMVFTKVLGPKTKTSRSPLILPQGAAVPGPGTTPPPPPPPPDCDSDGTPDASDFDDDNDGLSDDLENSIKTNPCAKDTDGDNIEDGFEYWSARDLNASAVPYPGKRPFPNALDGTDGAKDFDGDGMTQAEEVAAWNLYGGRVLPTGDNQTFPYSDGNQTSPAPGNSGGRDYDNNGKVTDEEKDADDDGIGNWIELAKGSTKEAEKTIFGYFKNPNGTPCGPGTSTTVRFQDCGAGIVPNGNTYTDGSFAAYFVPSYVDPDSDGDGINDGADDLDHDDFSDVSELAAGTNPVGPCEPNTESRSCQQH